MQLTKDLPLIIIGLGLILNSIPGLVVTGENEYKFSPGENAEILFEVAAAPVDRSVTIQLNNNGPFYRDGRIIPKALSDSQMHRYSVELENDRLQILLQIDNFWYEDAGFYILEIYKEGKKLEELTQISTVSLDIVPEKPVCTFVYDIVTSDTIWLVLECMVAPVTERTEEGSSCFQDGVKIPSRAGLRVLSNKNTITQQYLPYRHEAISCCLKNKNGSQNDCTDFEWHPPFDNESSGVVEGGPLANATCKCGPILNSPSEGVITQSPVSTKGGCNQLGAPWKVVYLLIIVCVILIILLVICLAILLITKGKLNRLLKNSKHLKVRFDTQQQSLPQCEAGQDLDFTEIREETKPLLEQCNRQDLDITDSNFNGETEIVQQHDLDLNITANEKGNKTLLQCKDTTERSTSALTELITNETRALSQPDTMQSLDTRGTTEEANVSKRNTEGDINTTAATDETSVLFQCNTKEYLQVDTTMTNDKTKSSLQHSTEKDLYITMATDETNDSTKDNLDTTEPNDEIKMLPIRNKEQNRATTLRTDDTKLLPQRNSRETIGTNVKMDETEMALQRNADKSLDSSVTMNQEQHDFEIDLDEAENEITQSYMVGDSIFTLNKDETKIELQRDTMQDSFCTVVMGETNLALDHNAGQMSSTTVTLDETALELQRGMGQFAFTNLTMDETKMVLQKNIGQLHSTTLTMQDPVQDETECVLQRETGRDFSPIVKIDDTKVVMQYNSRQDPPFIVTVIEDKNFVLHYDTEQETCYSVSTNGTKLILQCDIGQDSSTTVEIDEKELLLKCKNGEDVSEQIIHLNRTLSSNDNMYNSGPNTIFPLGASFHDRASRLLCYENMNNSEPILLNPTQGDYHDRASRLLWHLI